MKKVRNNFIITGILFVLFAVFTLSLLVIDVKPAGVDGTNIGYAGVNLFVHNTFGFNTLFYRITNFMNVIIAATVFGMVAYSIVRFVKMKGIQKLDISLALLFPFYITVFAFYVLFDKIVINYRPIILSAGLEPSYPSTHTLFVICIMVTALYQFKTIFCNKPTLFLVSKIFSFAVIAVTVIGRLISGVHWFTDIVGGIILSSALIMLYISFVQAAKLRIGKKYKLK
jgi:undecaprenyl-diphosphatase